MTYDTLEKSHIIIKILETFGVLTNKELHRKLPKLSPTCFKLLIHSPLTFTFTILMWLEVLNSEDLNQACDVLYVVLTEIALIVKLLNVWYHDALIKSMFFEWQQNKIFELQTTEECVIWRNIMKLYSVVAFLYIGCSLSVVGFAFTAVLYLSRYQLPFSYWLPFNWKDPLNYWYAYSYELITVPVTCISNSTADMFFCYMMLHLAMHFKVIAMRLEQLGFGKNETNSQVTRKLLTIIKLHLKLKSMSSSCEQIVSYPICAQVVLSAFILCFSLYRFQNFNALEDPGNFLSLVQFAVAMNLQILLPCYFANKLTIESSQLLNCIYNCNWYEMSPYNRKIIVIFMQYLQEPVVLKASIFFDIGLPVYTKTMNNAYSFFALLLNLE
ncbi:odorant receptor 94a-like isoform 1-T2 [Cochliomyia hominivorax]